MVLLATDTLMVLKIFALSILFFSIPLAYGSKEKEWKKLEKLGEEILQAKEINFITNQLKSSFLKQVNVLEKIQYKEVETENLTDQIQSHLERLNSRIFKKTTEAHISYLSWQNQAELKSSTSMNDLIITHSTFCVGGSIGKANKSVHYFTDGCLFIGKADVGTDSRTITYQQTNLETYGLRIAPALGYFVSSQNAEVGLKFPISYTHLELSTPVLEEYSINQGPQFQIASSVYFRWPVYEWHFQIEFGKFFGEETSLWGIGIGLKI